MFQYNMYNIISDKVLYWCTLQ